MINKSSLNKNTSITICSKKQIQKLIYKTFPENTAVISFYGENEKPVSFPAGIKNIRLNIDDLEIEEINNPDSYHTDDFRRVAVFILDSLARGMNIICQCEAGISRSSATAAAILEFYEQKGIKVFSDYRYNPNKFFYHGILRQLKEEYRKRQLSLIDNDEE